MKNWKLLSAVIFSENIIDTKSESFFSKFGLWTIFCPAVKKKERKEEEEQGSAVNQVIITYIPIYIWKNYIDGGLTT